MTIRKLTQDELPLIHEIGVLFWEESGLEGEYSEISMAENWRIFYEAGMGHIHGWFVGEELVGLIGGYTAPNPFNAEMETVETFWYVKPEHRKGLGAIRLLQAFEDEARERGSVCVSMVHLSNLNADAVRRLYLRRGYLETEVVYRKRL